jgi:hypothetical protein
MPSLKSPRAYLRMGSEFGHRISTAYLFTSGTNLLGAAQIFASVFISKTFV